MPDNTTTSEKIQLLDWIKNNPNVFGYLLLIFIIGWLFLDQRSERAECATREKALQTTISNLQTEALRVERERIARMEFLLNNLPKPDATSK